MTAAAAVTSQQTTADVLHPVLIVDDHAATAEMLRRFLARNGVAAAVAPDGQAALDLLAHDHKPSYMILDESMPGMTGLDLLRHIRNDPACRDIPVVFYSAEFEHRKQVEAQSLGARAWLVKGVSRLNELVEYVRSIRPA